MANTRGKNESSDRFYLRGLQESTCNAGDPGLIPGLGRSPGEGNGSPVLGMATAVFLPGEFDGQRTLAG